MFIDCEPWTILGPNKGFKVWCKFYILKDRWQNNKNIEQQPPFLSLSVLMSGVLLGHALVWTAQYIHVCDMICLRYHMLQKGLTVLHKNIQRNVFYTGSILLYLSRCFVNGLHKVKFVLSIVCQVINVAHGPLVLFCLFFMGGCYFLFVLAFSLGVFSDIQATT